MRRAWVGELRTRGYQQTASTGGWLYNILPYLELQSLHDLGINQGDDITVFQLFGFAHLRSKTPVDVFICPCDDRPVSCSSF